MNEKNRKLLVKVCINEWENASRDKKELCVCRELGAEVRVLAKGAGPGGGRPDRVEGFDVYRLSARPVKPLPVTMNRIISIFTWAHYVKGMHADIISGHDISGLTIGWLSNFFVRKDRKAKLVYDSHEFEIGRNVRRNRLQIWAITLWERFLISRSEFMIVVNDSIADEVVKIHKLKERPVVVRNIPPRWTVDEGECQKIREQFLADFGNIGGVLLMYHGAISRGRGVEDCLEILALDDSMRLILMGKIQDDAYRESLEKLIDAHGIRDRVRFYDPVAYEVLWKYAGAVDIEMMVVQPVVRSYYYGLPNKLFESIQAHVPVVATDLPEMRRIVDGYQVGELCRPYDIKDIYRGIRKITDDRELRKRYIANEVKASSELCWEVESEKLKKAYQKIWTDS